MEDEGFGPGEGAGAEYRVHLCFGPNCSARGSGELMPILERAIAEAGLTGRVEVLATTCRNRCDDAPSLNVYPGPVFYNWVDAAAVREIVERHLKRGQVAQEWVYQPGIPSRIRACSDRMASDS